MFAKMYSKFIISEIIIISLIFGVTVAAATNKNIYNNNNNYDDSDRYDIKNNINWKCANNATCVKELSNNIIYRVKNRKSINFGELKIEPSSVNLNQNPFSKRSSTNNNNESTFMQLLINNVIKIPIGPMLFTLQKSDKYENYLELAVMKKMKENDHMSRKLNKGNKDGDISAETKMDGGRGRLRAKRHLQILIPLFLAFNTVGWTMLAMKAVSVLTVKAFLLSKIALGLAIFNIAKKFMSNAAEKMFQHQPHYEPHYETHAESMIMPYNMEYGIPAHSFHGGGGGGAGGGGTGGLTEIGTNDLYTLHMAATHDGGAIIPAAIEPIESIGAESAVNQVIHLSNFTQGPPYNGIPTMAKVKRQDRNIWTGLRGKPLMYKYLPIKNPVYAYPNQQLIKLPISNKVNI